MHTHKLNSTIWKGVALFITGALVIAYSFELTSMGWLMAYSGVSLMSVGFWYILVWDCENDKDANFLNVGRRGDGE